MGRQIALQSALCGLDTVLVDVDPGQVERAAQANAQYLKERVDKGKLSAEEADGAQELLTYSTELSPVASERDWAIEAIPEVLELKQKAFAALDQALPAHAGIASNSSNMVVSRVAESTARPDKCCNMHFFFPPLVMDICEVVRGPQTSDETIERALRLAARINRHPVLVNRELDGFVVNRILGAGAREAFTLLSDGIASFVDIDTAARAGLNWPMGPFQLADAVGLDVVCDVRRDRYARENHPGDKATIEILEPFIAAGRLGRKSGSGFYDYGTDPPKPLSLPR